MPWVYRMTLTLSLLLLPAFIYIGFRFSSAMTKAASLLSITVSKKRVRLIVFIFIIWIYILPVVFIIYYLIGNFHQLFVFKPNLQWQDYLLLYPFWCGSIAIIEIFPYFLTMDILSGLFRYKPFSFILKNIPTVIKQRSLQWLPVLKVFLVLFFVIYASIRSYNDTNYIRIHQTPLTINNLPKELNGLKIGLFGDIHINRFTPQKKKQKMQEFLHNTDDDFIFFTGDLVSRGIDYIDQSINITCNPKGKIANIACMGDHDYWAAPRKIAREMKQCGWKFLQNRHYLTQYNGFQILITGITYIYSERISPDDLEKLLSDAPPAQLKIIVVHQPMEFLVECAARHGYQLILAGHTHGGQIVPHLFGFPFSPSQLETQFFRGIYNENSVSVIVTNGIGQTLAPLRYHAPAQIDRIILRNN